MGRIALTLCAFVLVAALSSSTSAVSQTKAPLDGPSWAQGQGSADLMSAINERAEQGVREKVVTPAQAQAVREQVAALAAEDAAHRERRDYSEAQFADVMHRLMIVASSLPEVAPEHPLEPLPTDVDWSTASSGQPLDLKGYSLTFQDDFNHMSVTPDGGAGPWYAPVHTNFGEARFVGPGADDTFVVRKEGPMPWSGRVLRIHARKTKEGWTSGLIQTVDSHGRGFAQTYGYFEMRARLPRGHGTWPAFWLLTRNSLTDPTVTRGEIDGLEQYGNEPDRLHTSVHLWPAAARNAGGVPKHWYRSYKTGISGLSDGFHSFGVMITPEWTIDYVDGREVARIATLAQHRTPMYVLVDLTMHPKDLRRAPPSADLDIDYVRVYAKAPSPPPAAAS